MKSNISLRAYHKWLRYAEHHGGRLPMKNIMFLLARIAHILAITNHNPKKPGKKPSFSDFLPWGKFNKFPGAKVVDTKYGKLPVVDIRPDPSLASQVKAMFGDKAIDTNQR